MSIHKVNPADASLQTVLQKARAEPVILQTEAEGDFAVLDLLLERHPRFIEECRPIRERMRQGDFVTYEEALRLFQETP